MFFYGFTDELDKLAMARLLVHGGKTRTALQARKGKKLVSQQSRQSGPSKTPRKEYERASKDVDRHLGKAIKTGLGSAALGIPGIASMGAGELAKQTARALNRSKKVDKLDKAQENILKNQVA